MIGKYETVGGGVAYHSLTPKTAVLGAVLEKQKLHPGKTACPYALSHRGSRLRVSAKGVGDRLSDTKPGGYAKRSRTKPAVSGVQNRALRRNVLVTVRPQAERLHVPA